MNNRPTSRFPKGKFVSGSVWALIGKVGAGLGMLFVNALLVRLLSPTAFGAYLLAFSLVTIASVIAQLGLNYAVVRFIAESVGVGQPGRARDAIRITLRMGTLGALIVAGILASGTGEWLAHHLFASPMLAGAIGFIAVWIIITVWQNLMAESFRGFHDIARASIFGGLFVGLLNVTLSILFLTLVWLIVRHVELIQILALLTVVAGFSAVIAAFVLRTRTRDLATDGSLHYREVLSVAWPMLVTNLGFVVLVQADIWILGVFRSPQEVAIFGAALRLASLVVFPLIIVNAVMPPMIAEMYAQGRRTELEHILRAAATLGGVVALPLLVTYIFFGEAILSLVFGDYYREAAAVLVILGSAQLVNVLMGSSALTLMMTGYQTPMMMITVVAGVMAIALSIWLVRAFGPVGVAWGMASGIVAQNLAMWLTAKLTVGVWTHPGVGQLPRLIKTGISGL